MRRLFRREYLSHIGTGIVAFLLSAAFVATAATTINSNIDTGGTLTVTGAIWASSTAQVTGAITTYGGATFGDAAADVQLFTGQLQASSTALFGNSVSFYNAITLASTTATTTVSFSGTGVNFDSNTFVIDPNANRVGILKATPQTALDVAGTASSTNLIVGGGTSVGGIVLGTCSVDPQSIAVGTSTVVSTSCAATGVKSGDKVFVTPPSDSVSDDNWLVFEGASASSTSDFIEITLFNSSTTVAIDGAPRTWTWMAIR